ncbi:hypothetical protein [Nocardioides sp. Soil805]|uniref:hypothetical protein n=1 Tax=Nocardioides sp. Soil805 TaxID=1736416 RepID=UPI000702A158|nr:hypothetical protein [Nocardioides sp. Soil805]KRF34326.1 hypothetical protein ASG94_16600 [Nocardioides sp. Soil805]
MDKVWPWLFHVEDEDIRTRRPVLALDAASVHVVALVLLLGQVALRCWMLVGSWFYTDDYRLLAQSRGESLDLDYLTAPFDSQFMPVGRLLAWVVSNTGEVATGWGTAVTLTMLTSTLAALACWWMLVTVFGARLEVLPLFALYLYSALSAPALMWWAAGLNQLPLQAVWFTAVATWVHYLRGRRWPWLAATTAVLVVGLLCYVKVLLVLPVLALVALGYFASGGPRARLTAALRRYWPAAIAGGLTAALYVVYYAVAVPQPFIEQDRGSGLAGALADTMLGTAFGSSALGGPWRWDTSNPPTGYADPPAWAVHLAWVVLVGTIVTGALLRRRTGRAWLLLALSLTGAYLLLLTTRAPVAGAAIGLEMRYLTETVCALVLTLGLVWLPVRGAVESSEPRPRPLLAVAPTQVLAGVLTLAYLVGAVVSTASYAHIWHTDNPGDTYLHRVTAAVDAQGSLDLTGGTVPQDVMPGYSFPYNTLESLVPLYTSRAEFPLISSTLHSVTEDGTVAPTVIDAAVTSRRGPTDECGWRVGASGRSIPLENGTIDVDWWLRIGYLSSQRTDITVTAGDVSREATVNPGIGSLFVQATGAFDEVRISGLAPETTLCVDVIEVGTAVPGVL